MSERAKINALLPGQPGRSYIVGTFPGDHGMRPSAYTVWYNPAWPGCIEYEVMAPTGDAAKRAAIKARKEEEGRTP